MRKAIYWILVVVLVCSEGVFSACTKADGPDDARFIINNYLMKSYLFTALAFAALLLGVTTACNRDPIPIEDLEKELVGMWWDEYAYHDVTEDGVPFARVPLAIYGGPERVVWPEGPNGIPGGWTAKDPGGTIIEPGGN